MNRYGRWKWYEYGLTAVNMTAAVYMANTIDTDWGEMATTFNFAMLVMLLCVAVMYFIQIRLNEQDTGAARNMLTILTVDLFLYLVAFLASVINPGQIVLWIDVAAVLIGAFLPFFIRGRFDISIISFPHLVERFEIKDAVMSVGFLLIGAAIMLLVRSTIYGLLIGALIAACGNFVMLLMKYKGVSVK